MTRATPTRWAPHWQTIDGVVYMTETGGSHYLDPLNLLFGQYQVGYKERRDEDGMLLTGDITQKRTGMNSVEITGSDESDFIRLEKDAHSVVDGGAGNDTIKGGRVSDVIRSGTGNDYVRGGGGDDQVFGGTGNDRVTGGNGDDELHGGAGDDFIFGGRGTDIMFGGAGQDIFFLKDALDPHIGDFRQITETADIIKDFEQGSDKIRLGTYEHVTYQNVVVGDDAYNDILIGDMFIGAEADLVTYQNVIVGDDAYTLILGLDVQGTSHVRGIIEGDVDLETSDFKNVLSVTELPQQSVDPWDAHVPEHDLPPLDLAGDSVLL